MSIGRIQVMVMLKEFGNCIKTSRLCDAVAGRVKLDELERQHLHECGVCQSVLHIFVQLSGLPVPATKKPSAA